MFCYELFIELTACFILSARVAISCEVIAQLAKDYAENTSYMKDLPALVQRELSRALVIAGSAIENDLNRKQYLSQVRTFRILVLKGGEYE